MESTKDLLERSKELKKNIRAGLNKNKSVLTQSRESRAIRQAKLKKIKESMNTDATRHGRHGRRRVHRKPSACRRRHGEPMASESAAARTSAAKQLRAEAALA